MHIDNLEDLNLRKYKLNVGNVPIKISINKCFLLSKILQK